MENDNVKRARDIMEGKRKAKTREIYQKMIEVLKGWIKDNHNQGWLTGLALQAVAELDSIFHFSLFHFFLRFYFELFLGFFFGDATQIFNDGLPHGPTRISESGSGNEVGSQNTSVRCGTSFISVKMPTR